MLNQYCQKYRKLLVAVCGIVIIFGGVWGLIKDWGGNMYDQCADIILIIGGLYLVVRSIVIYQREQENKRFGGR